MSDKCRNKLSREEVYVLRRCPDRVVWRRPCGTLCEVKPETFEQYFVQC